MLLEKNTCKNDFGFRGQTAAEGEKLISEINSSFRLMNTGISDSSLEVSKTILQSRSIPFMKIPFKN